jgi:hypothetical protein
MMTQRERQHKKNKRKSKRQKLAKIHELLASDDDYQKQLQIEQLEQERQLQEEQRQLQQWLTQEAELIAKSHITENTPSPSLDQTVQNIKEQSNEENIDLSIYGPSSKLKNPPIAITEQVIDQLLQNSEYCKFYLKTGCCSYGYKCRRTHLTSFESPTLLFPGMFVPIMNECIEQTTQKTDDQMSNKQSFPELIQQRLQYFLDDVIPELKQFGEIIQLKVDRKNILFLFLFLFYFPCIFS